MPQLNHEQRQRLFNYFSEAHDLLLLEDDFRMIDDLICSQNSVKLPVSGALPLSGGEIITKAIDRSKDLNRSKYDGTSYRFGYMAGFEDAQSIAVGGNDR